MIVRHDRFQPQGPVRDPAGSTAPQQPPRDWWRLAREAVPVLGLAGVLLGWATGYITTNATGAADSRWAAKQQAKFEADTDARLKEAWTRMDQIDRDRDGRTVIINKRVDDLAEGLRGQIDGLNRKLDQRSETRGNQVNELGQRLGNLELKVCVLSGLRVSQCK